MNKVKVAPRVTIASLRRSIAALTGPTQGLPKWRRLCRLISLKPCEYNAVDAMPLGANARYLRSGRGYRMACGWQYIKLSLWSALFCVARVLRFCVMHPFRLSLRISASYHFFWHMLLYYCYLLFGVLALFLVFVHYFILPLERCRCPSDLILSSRPRTGLATTYITGYG